MNYSDLLHPPGDKVSLGEMALLKSKLPARATKAIPACIYTDDKHFDYEVVILHFWIMVRRENKDITVEEVGDLIGLKETEDLDQIEKEILYFYTRRTREDIEDSFREFQEALERADAALGESKLEPADAGPPTAEERDEVANTQPENGEVEKSADPTETQESPAKS